MLDGTIRFWVEVWDVSMAVYSTSCVVVVVVVVGGREELDDGDGIIGFLVWCK